MKRIADETVLKEMMSMDSSKFVVILDGATCGACKMLESSLKGKSEKIYVMDVTNAEGFKNFLNITQVPTVLFISDKEIKNHVSGITPTLRNSILSHVS